MPSMPVALLSWKPIARNTLRGFADVRIGKSLVIREVSLHTANGKRWASLPSKPMMKGTQIVIGENGKVRYTPIIEWADVEARNSFSEGVVAAVEAQHPGATSADAA